MHIPMFGCWMCRWWWNPLWFCKFFCLHIYIYIYIYTHCPHVFLLLNLPKNKPNLGQPWGTIQFTALVFSVVNKNNCTSFQGLARHHNGKLPVIWDDNDEHFQTLRPPSDGIPLRGRISLCLQDASLGGGNLGTPGTILEGPSLHRDSQCYTGREDESWRLTKLDPRKMASFISGFVSITRELWRIEATESDLSMKGQDRHNILSQ
jgi:hypothetical protein